MKNNITIAMIMMAGLLLGGYHTFAQTAEELFPKAIQLEEVKGDLGGAIKIYQSILKQYPENSKICAKATLHMGLCYEKQGSDLARQAYRDLISKYGDQTDEVVQARERISRLEAHVAELNTLAQQHMKQGNELFKLWEYKDAIKEYEDAIKLRPNTLLAMNAQYCIGQSLYRAGEFDAALATFTNLLKEDPNSTIAPVTELMVSQVEYAIENTKDKVAESNTSGSNAIVDPETGITFTKAKTLNGGNDIITYTNALNLSPNGKYLLLGNKVVPLDRSAPFDLIDYNSTGIKVTRATWSPDGTMAAFYSGDAICIVPVSPETGHSIGPLKRIVEGPFLYQTPPAWSPDGNRIAYLFQDGNIWTVSVDGSDVKQITDNEDFEHGPAWSPDGSVIAYGIGNRSIGLYDIKNDISTELVDAGFRCFPKWSPDGEWIIVNWQKLHLYNLQDKTHLEFTVPEDAGNCFSVSQENNNMLFFRTSYFDNTRLKIASSHGGPSFEPIPRLTSWGVDSWSKDNNLMAVQSENEKGEIAFRIVSLNGKVSKIIELDHLTEGKPFPFNVTKDLDKLLFIVDREDGKEDLYSVPISAEDARTNGPAIKIYEGWYRQGAFNVRFSLSPDGEKVALIDQDTVWIVFTNGDPPEQIQSVPGGIEYLRWTPDSKSLLYANPSTGWNLLENPGPRQRVVPLKDDGKEIEGRFWHLAISPDVSQIAVISAENLKIIPFDPDKSTRILDLKKYAFSDPFNLCWSPDGKNLAFIGQKESDDPASDPDDIFQIYNFPLNGEQPIMVAPDDTGSKWGLSWSPDGKWIAFGPETPVKVRPESILWEADFDEVIEKLTAQ